MTDHEFLLQAIEQSKESDKQGGFPAGTVIAKNGEIIARGVSIGNILHDPTSHGEVSAIREATKNLNDNNLEGVVIYSSLEPCLMCLGASMWAGVSKIIFACSKSKVSPEYYGGNYQSDDLNNKFLKPIEIFHMSELEEESLKVIIDWEH